jgi:hypothetical protein
MVYEAYEVKNKREKLRCLLLPEKDFFYIYDVITVYMGKKKKALLITSHI